MIPHRHFASVFLTLTLILANLGGAARASAENCERILNFEKAIKSEFELVIPENQFTHDTAVSANGKTLAVGANPDIFLFDLDNLNPLGRLSGHGDELRDLELSANGKILMSTSADGTLKLWKTDTRQVVYSTPSVGKSVVSGSFSPDGTMVAYYSSDGLLRIYTTEGNRKIMKGGVKGASFYPQFKFLSDNSMLMGTRADDYLVQIELPSNKAKAYSFNEASLDKLAAPLDVYKVEISPDEQYVMALHGDMQETTATVWRIKDQQLLFSKQVSGSLGAFFSQDSKHLVILGGPNSSEVKIATVQNGNVVSSFQGPAMASNGTLDANGNLTLVTREQTPQQREVVRITKFSLQ